MALCETCAGHDRPEIVLSQAMAQTRTLAQLVSGGASELMDERTYSIARTIIAIAEDRRVADDRCAGPLQGLIERLDRIIAAATRQVPHLSVVGADEDGLVHDLVLRDEVDPAYASLVTLRNQAGAALEMIERARDAVAADEAINRMREAIRR